VVTAWRRRTAPDPGTRMAVEVELRGGGARDKGDVLSVGQGLTGKRLAAEEAPRLFRQEGIRWRRTRRWASSKDPDFVPKGRRSSPSTPNRRPEPLSSASTHGMNSVP